MKRNLRSLSLVLMTGIFFLLLSGCYVPENFDIKVKVNKDGSYVFSYDGTLVNVFALSEAKKGPLSKGDEAGLEKEAEAMRREPGFKEVKYLGSGRYKVVVEKTGKPGETYYFLSRELRILAIEPQKDGSMQISSIRPQKKEIVELGSIGLKVAGVLTVSVARGVKILRHNAQKVPRFFGLFGAYVWEIKSPDANPVIVLRPAV